MQYVALKVPDIEILGFGDDLLWIVKHFLIKFDTVSVSNKDQPELKSPLNLPHCIGGMIFVMKKLIVPSTVITIQSKERAKIFFSKCCFTNWFQRIFSFENHKTRQDIGKSTNKRRWRDREWVSEWEMKTEIGNFWKTKVFHHRRKSWKRSLRRRRS